MSAILWPCRFTGITIPKTAVQRICRQHLSLTHPDAFLARIADAYVNLLGDLLFRRETETQREFVADIARRSMGVDVSSLVAKARSDNDVIGGRYSPACYITDSWPGVLYLAYKYVDDPKAALLANTNLGGDNVHRGAVLGAILGVATGRTLDALFHQLQDSQAIDREISALIGRIN